MFFYARGILCFQQGKQNMKIIIPESIAPTLIKTFHESHKLMHASAEKMKIVLTNVFLFKNFLKTAQIIVGQRKFSLQYKPNKLGKQPIYRNRLYFQPRKILSLDLVHVNHKFSH